LATCPEPANPTRPIFFIQPHTIYSLTDENIPVDKPAVLISPQIIADAGCFKKHLKRGVSGYHSCNSPECDNMFPEYAPVMPYIEQI
jgi:hypothetical protein